MSLRKRPWRIRLGWWVFVTFEETILYWYGYRGGERLPRWLPSQIIAWRAVRNA